MKLYKKYTDLSNDYFWSYDDLENRNKKKLFLIILGPVGSGKTTLAKLIQLKMSKCIYISYDQFYKDNHKDLYNKFCELILSLNESNSDIILDGFYGLNFHEIEKLLIKYNYDIHIINKKVYGHTVIDNIINRIKLISKRNINILKYVKLYREKVNDIKYYDQQIKRNFNIDL